MTEKPKNPLRDSLRDIVSKHLPRAFVAAMIGYAVQFVQHDPRFPAYIGFIKSIPVIVAIIALYVILGIVGAFTGIQAVIGLYASKPTMSKKRVLGCVALSVTCCILGFATAYGQMSYDCKAFSLGNCPLSPIGALYFSIVTFATVGYGDIAPINDLTRAISASQIIIAMLYNLLILSLVAGFIREAAQTSAARESVVGDSAHQRQPPPA